MSLNPAHVGVSARFTDPKQKSNHQQRTKSPGITCERREDRPRHDNPSQSEARSKAVAQPATRNFKQRVSQPKGTEDQAHLLVIDVQRRLNVLLSTNNALTIVVSEKREHAQKRHHTIADKRRAFRNDCWPNTHCGDSL
jgi:hypothetical protein